MPELTSALIDQVGGDAVARTQVQRLRNASNHTLDATGKATVMFKVVFPAEPSLSILEIEATESSMALSTRALNWIRDENGAYTGVVVHALRARQLPLITALNSSLITLIGPLITGINSILAQLSGFNTHTTPAAGTKVSVIAITQN